VTTAIGATLRAAARSEGQTSEFERDQLMSAYSAQVAEGLRAAEIPSLHQELLLLAKQLDGATSASDVGETICVLFESLDRAPSPRADALRAAVHVRLRALSDREVDLLADALG